MPTVRGRADVKRYMTGLPAEIEKKVLRGAARAAGAVVADEARLRAPAAETREAITTRSKAEPGRITVSVTVKPGFGRSLGFWSEYGTSPHFITVDEGQRAGRSIGRINKQLKANDGNASLVIGGKFVGSSVLHPGAQAHPFLRPALDLKQAAAMASAQSFINSRISGGKIVGAAEPEGDDE